MADKDLLDYPSLVRRALLGVVREVLDRTAREGLPGEHHFFLSLRTDHTGVSVALRFAGRPARLSVPFEALVAFTDPAVPLGLRLADSPAGEKDSPATSQEPPAPETPPAAGWGNRVVPFQRPPRGE
jgi:hypothetical protein